MPSSQFGSSEAGEGVVEVDAVGETEGLGEPEGVTDGEGVGDSIIHGGRPSKQEPALRRMRGIQHPSTPPGRSPQFAPPHTPHDPRQQTEPKLRIAMTPVEQSGSAVNGEGEADIVCGGDIDALGDSEGVWEGVGEAEAIMQGGKALSQLTPELRILLIQQFLAPPGAAPHMEPPHVRHELGQQTEPPERVLEMPVSQFGSAESGEGEEVREIEAETEGVAAGTQGAFANEQDLSSFRMREMQQPIAPPS